MTRLCSESANLHQRQNLNQKWSRIQIQISVLIPIRLSVGSLQQEVKVISQKAPHGGPIPRLGVTPGGRKSYHWIPGVGFPISVP